MSSKKHRRKLKKVHEGVGCIQLSNMLNTIANSADRTAICLSNFVNNINYALSMNIELIKQETRTYYISDGKETSLLEKVKNLKEDVRADFKKWKESNPYLQFSDFKDKSIEEMKAGMQFLGEIIYVGLFLIALEEIEQESE
ncbi:hypothetical protein [Chryseobacterium oncorhynchi]|nr:hypothetical protein [Chryseobacterium oncorhynchi]